MYISKMPVIALIIFCLFASGINAQNEGDSKKTLNYESQLKISATAFLFDNISIKNTGENLLTSKPLPSVEFNFIYSHHIKNGFGINAGVGYTVFPSNLRLRVQEGVEKGIGDIGFTEYSANIFNIPISAQKIFSISKEKNIRNYAELGAKLNLIINYPYSVESILATGDNMEEVIPFFKYNITSIDKQRFLVSFLGKYGFLHILRNQNTIQYGLAVNYSPFNIGEGQFEFFNMPKNSKGIIRQSINYIGLEFIYGFSLFK